MALATPPGRGTFALEAATWLPALRLGLGALGIGLAMQYALGVVMGLVQVLAGATVDWGGTLRAPLTVFLSLHGPVSGLGLWLTGSGWVVLSFWLAGRGHRGEWPGTWLGRLTLAAQAAGVYIVPVLVVAIAMNPEALPIDLTVGVAGAFVDPSAYGGWSPGLVAALGTLTALVAALSVVGSGAVGEVRGRLPAPMTAGFDGMRVLLATAVPGVLAIVTVGVIIEVMARGAGLALGAAYLLTLLLAAVAWGGLDVGVAFVVFSMRFFGGDGLVILGGRPAWVFACVAMVAVAFLRGGHRAARALGPAPIARVALASGAAGVMAAIALGVGAALNTGTVSALAGPAFGLGLLWSAVSVLGGLSQASFRPGTGRQSNTPPAPPPAQ